MNKYAIGLSYNKAWTIVYGDKNLVVDWIVNNKNPYVFGNEYNSEEEMLGKIEYYRNAEEYESAKVHKILDRETA